MAILRTARLVKALASSRQGASRVNELATLRGLPAKLSQLLFLKELDRPNTANSSSAIPITLSRHEVTSILYREFGDVSDYLALSDEDGKAASIGEVHFGTWKGSQALAIKVRYPDIEHIIKCDLQGLVLTSHTFALIQPAFNLSAFKKDVKERILQELDYKKELTTLQLFKSIYQNIPRLKIPGAYDFLSSNCVLTMERLSGRPLHECLDTLSEECRFQVAETLLRFALTSWFATGIIQADPNPANFLVEVKDGEVTVGIVDFGSSLIIPQNKIVVLQRLCTGQYKNSDEVLSLFEQLGFDVELVSPLREKLLDLCTIVSLPLRTDGPFDLRSWQVKHKLKKLLGRDIWNFRLAGPPYLLWFIRSFSGTVHLIRALQVHLNWRQLFDEGCPSATTPRNLQVSRSKARGEALTKQNLKVEVLVREQGRDKVRVVLPYAVLERIEEIMPSEIVAKLSLRDSSPGRMAKQWYLNNKGPGIIFREVVDQKVISICCVQED